MTTPYTYLIGWTSLNKFYYGSRYATDCHPDDLFVRYFTSSKQVKRILKENGNPDVIIVRRTFESVEQARHWEHKVLRRLNVINNDKWINKTDNKAISPMLGLDNPMYGKVGNKSHRYGKKLSKQTKKIIGEKSRKKRGNMPPDFSEKMRAIVTGRKHSETAKQKISQKLTGRTFSEAHKQKISLNHVSMLGENNPFYGKTHSSESKAKMSANRMGTVFVNNGSERKRIKSELLEHFLNQGWQRGKGRW